MTQRARISPKIIILYALRALGVFALAQRLTRDRLRILCYHGFAIGDEYESAPMMFMRGSTFENRLKVLKRRRIPVLSLDEAVRKFKDGEIANCETVITLDDGWTSNLSIGLPILKRYGYPACIYITTEHLSASTEVFNVVLGYMIRRSKLDVLKIRGLHSEIDGDYSLRPDTTAAVLKLIVAAEKALPLAERQKLLQPISIALGLNLDEVLHNGRFRLLEPQEIVELYNNGIDIQLHTHTHRLPDRDFDSMAFEINENRKALHEVLGREQNHFCYPSGVYSQDHPKWLEKLGIESGTTCDVGLNPPGTSTLLLKRFLDRDDFSDIEFESEVAGVRELVRNFRSFF